MLFEVFTQLSVKLLENMPQREAGAHPVVSALLYPNKASTPAPAREDAAFSKNAPSVTRISLVILAKSRDAPPIATHFPIAIPTALPQESLFLVNSENILLMPIP